MTWLNYKVITSGFKYARQHFVYVVMVILLAAFVYEGLFFLIPLLLFFYLRFKKWSVIFVGVFVAALVLLHLAHLPPTVPELSAEVEAFSARVIEVRRQTDDRQSAVVQIEGKRVFVSTRQVYPRLLPGYHVTLTGRLGIPNTPTVPYRFNFQQFLFYQHIHLSLFATEFEVTGQSFSPWAPQHLIGNWVRTTFPPRTAAYIQSFFLGLRGDMDEDMMDVYGEMGLLQVFAISGVHVTLLAGMIKYFLKRIGLIDTIVDALLILFCVAFIFATGGSVSVIRASGMFILGILSRRFKLGTSSFDHFSLLFILTFLFNPLILYQRGFQLSYWISFMFVASRPALATFGPITSKFYIAFLARMASMPIVAASQFEIPLVSIINNLLIVPLLMQLIFPALLITIFLPFLAPLTEQLLILFEALTLRLHPILSLNLIIGHLPLIVVLMLTASLLIFAWTFERQKSWMAIAAILFFYFFTFEATRLSQMHTTLTFIDVGQGDATVIRSPHQRCTVVVDTGGDLTRIRRDNPSIFPVTLEPYLLGSGVRDIDFLILTHESYDHINEAIPLIERFNVRQIIINDDSNWGHQMLPIIEAAYERNIPIHVARTFDNFACGNQVYTFIQDAIHGININEDSLVTTVEINGFNILLTADIGHPSEAAILANNHLDEFLVYQVAHHGSRYSNSLSFMDALNIRYAVVQAGVRNPYGHPHVELIEVVDALGIPLLNTIYHGTVRFKLFNEHYEIHVMPR